MEPYRSLIAFYVSSSNRTNHRCILLCVCVPFKHDSVCKQHIWHWSPRCIFTEPVRSFMMLSSYFQIIEICTPCLSRVFFPNCGPGSTQ